MRVVSGAASDKHITLGYEGPKKLVHKLDRRAFKQIMLNLLSNAIKFTPEHGNVKILVEQTAERLSITIEDNGIGIPQSEIAKLGRPFEQIENQFTKSHSGTGLGLAISRSLMELHQGHLHIKSAVNIGTRVSCHFPSNTNKKQAIANRDAA